MYHRIRNSMLITLFLIRIHEERERLRTASHAFERSYATDALFSLGRFSMAVISHIKECQTTIFSWFYLQLWFYSFYMISYIYSLITCFSKPLKEEIFFFFNMAVKFQLHLSVWHICRTRTHVALRSRVALHTVAKETAAGN